MRADRVSDRHRLVARGGLEIDGAHVARRDQVDAGLPRPAQHDAAAADIGEPGAGKQREVDAGGNIRRAVGAVLQMHRQRAEIGVVALEHHLLHRRLLRRHRHRRMQCLEALAERRKSSRSSVSSACASRLREPMTLPTSSAFSGPAALKCTARGLPSRTPPTSRRSVGALWTSHSPSVGQLFDEIAQPEALGIDRGHGRLPTHAIRVSSADRFRTAARGCKCHCAREQSAQTLMPRA